MFQVWVAHLDVSIPDVVLPRIVSQRQRRMKQADQSSEQPANFNEERERQTPVSQELQGRMSLELLSLEFINQKRGSSQDWLGLLLGLGLVHSAVLHLHRV